MIAKIEIPANGSPAILYECPVDRVARITRILAYRHTTNTASTVDFFLVPFGDTQGVTFTFDQFTLTNAGDEGEVEMDGGEIILDPGDTVWVETNTGAAGDDNAFLFYTEESKPPVAAQLRR